MKNLKLYKADPENVCQATGHLKQEKAELTEEQTRIQEYDEEHKESVVSVADSIVAEHLEAFKELAND